MLPAGLNQADSIKMANRLIEDWLKKQLLLNEANKNLSVKEKNFEKELDAYKKELLVNAYFQKLTLDSAQFSYTDEELQEILHQYEEDFDGEKVIVKLNYAKLSPKSKVLKPLRNILFDERRRMFEKDRIEELCADSIEYFIEDHTWLYLDDIKQELPINLEKEDEITDQNRNIERKSGDYLYLIVLLDKNSTPNPIANSENIEAAKKMVIQQKKTRYIDQYIEALYQKALKDNTIIR
jgi:hypothetical protein